MYCPCGQIQKSTQVEYKKAENKGLKQPNILGGNIKSIFEKNENGKL